MALRVLEKTKDIGEPQGKSGARKGAQIFSLGGGTIFFTISGSPILHACLPHRVCSRARAIFKGSPRAADILSWGSL